MRTTSLCSKWILIQLFLRRKKTPNRSSFLKPVSASVPRCGIRSPLSIARGCGKAGAVQEEWLLLPCPLLLICDAWKQVTAHLTAHILWCSCYAGSSTCKHLPDSCLLRVSADCKWRLGSTCTSPSVCGIALLHEHTVELEGSTNVAGDTLQCLARSTMYFQTFVNYLERISRHYFWRVSLSLW